MRINLCNINQLKCFPHVFSFSSSCVNVTLCFAVFQHFFGNTERLIHGMWRIYHSWGVVEGGFYEIGEESKFFRLYHGIWRIYQFFVVVEVEFCEVGEESNFFRQTPQ